MLFLALSCTRFKVSGLMLRSLNHFEMILVQGDKHGSTFSFLQADNPVFPAKFVEKTVFSPSYVFGTFVKLRWA
jgi:hypothetical protein